uniref:Sec-independent protein translocase component TatC n=1 Tax=Hypnea wynnei TaxID=1867777 RepID=UPI0030019AD0|nr:Sec-independent protein translocase component TatC [Hypnea wynnei]
MHSKRNSTRLHNILIFYTSELLYRIFYWVVCFLLCNYLIFKNISLVIFIESFFFFKLGFDQFILMNVTDLLDLMWYICLKNSLFFSSIYFYYSVVYFFKPCSYFYQYFYQIKLYSNFIKIGIFSLCVFYLSVLPLVLKFLTQWDLQYFKNLLHVKYELSLLYYVTWLFYIKFFFIFMCKFFSWLFVQIYFLVELKLLYTILSKFKKQIFYGILCFLYLLSPPEVVMQILLLIINMILVEAFYFYICFVMQNTNIYKYAYNTTTIKKISKKKT